MYPSPPLLSLSSQVRVSPQRHAVLSPALRHKRRRAVGAPGSVRVEAHGCTNQGRGRVRWTYLNLFYEHYGGFVMIPFIHASTSTRVKYRLDSPSNTSTSPVFLRYCWGYVSALESHPVPWFVPQLAGHHVVGIGAGPSYSAAVVGSQVRNRENRRRHPLRKHRL